MRAVFSSVTATSGAGEGAWTRAGSRPSPGLAITFCATSPCCRSASSAPVITAAWSGKSASCVVDCQPAQRTGTVFDADVGLNVRSGPGTDNPVVDRRSNGDVLIVERVENGWCKVLYRSAAGQAARGYVSADYLQLSN